MKFSLVVMRAPHVLLAIAVLLFLGFLASPAFVESVQADGTVTMLPGYGVVLWYVLVLPYAVDHSRRDALFLVSLFMAHIAFLVLPVLVVLRRFRSLALRVFFSLLFVAGFISMASIIGRYGARCVRRISLVACSSGCRRFLFVATL